MAVKERLKAAFERAKDEQGMAVMVGFPRVLTSPSFAYGFVAGLIKGPRR